MSGHQNNITSTTPSTSQESPKRKRSSIAPGSSLLAMQATSTTNGGRSNEIIDDFLPLEPERLTKAVNDVMCQGFSNPRPPRPCPGLVSIHATENPSSSETVKSRIDSISHRLVHYFRGMLVDLLQELGTNMPEAEIVRLKLEHEELKHKHAKEIQKIKKNNNSTLTDMQTYFASERIRIVAETRSACEQEYLKRIADAE